MPPAPNQLPGSTTPANDLEAIEIDLKDPWLSAFLAWMIPGLGHLYQGRTGKGLLFMICILGTFSYGFYLGDGKVVYASSPRLITRWQYFCQLGAGLPAVPALLQRGHVKKNPQAADTWQDLMRPPAPPAPGQLPFTSTDQSGNTVQHPDELAKWHHDLADRFELGTVFTVIAGLLNVLAIYDAYAGPMVIPLDEADKGSKEKNGGIKGDNEND